MRPFFLVLFLAAPQARASVWDFESGVSRDRQALRAAADTSASEVRYLTQLALEQEKIALLKKQVDLGASGANDAARIAHSLDERCQQAWSDADDAMRGVGRRPAPEKSIAANASWFDDLSAYVRRLGQDESSFGMKGDSGTRRQADDALNAAKQLLDRVDSRIKAMKDDLERMQSRYRQLRSLKDDIQRAASDISDANLSLQNLAPATKGRIDALGSPPENETRTAASQKIDEFRAPVGTLSLASSTLLNRSDDFSRHWMAFEKLLQDFDSMRDSNDFDLGEARKRSDEARVLIDRLGTQAQSSTTP